MTTGESNTPIQGAETILDPELEIIDPHHHLADYFDPPYLLDDLLRDTGSGHNVTGTVFIECGWDWSESEGPSNASAVAEVQRVAASAAESLSRRGAVIRGIVGYADLRHGAAADLALDELAEAGDGKLVGIRHAALWDPTPGLFAHRSRPTEHLMGDETFRAGIARVARRNLTFDALVSHQQIPDVTELARAFPDTLIVLNHLGCPLSVGPYADHADEVFARWREAMVELQRNPNVFVKLGGIGMSVMRLRRPSDESTRATSADLAEAWGGHIRWCIDLFGPDRCMFESNFPVDRHTCEYNVLWNAFKLMVADASEAEKAALFRETARTAYSLT